MSSYANNFIYVPEKYNDETDKQLIALNDLSVTKTIHENKVSWVFYELEHYFEAKACWWKSQEGVKKVCIKVQTKTCKIKFSEQGVKIAKLGDKAKKYLWQNGTFSWGVGDKYKLVFADDTVTISSDQKQCFYFDRSAINEGENSKIMTEGSTSVILSAGTFQFGIDQSIGAVSFEVQDAKRGLYTIDFQEIHGGLENLQVVFYKYGPYSITAEHVSETDVAYYRISWKVNKVSYVSNRYITIDKKSKTVTIEELKEVDYKYKNEMVQDYSTQNKILAFSDFPMQHGKDFLNKAMDAHMEEEKYYSEIIHTATDHFDQLIA